MKIVPRKHFFLLILVPSLAFAGGDDIIQSNDNNNQTAGDISHSVSGDSSRSYGFSHSLGDVDLNDCMGSTQWGTILVSKQKLVLNKWCAAESYDMKGLHEVAAKLRCTIPEISSLFNDESLCLEANTQKGHVERPVALESEADQDEDDDEHREELDALYARISAIESDRQSEAENARKAAYAARQAAKEAELAEQERREYAQQTLEALKEYKQ